MGNSIRIEANPYSPVPGSVPPVLTGRDADLREISRAIRDTASDKAHNTSVFVGERGMGKTTMLRTAQQMAREKNAVVLHAEMSAGRSLREQFDVTGGFTQAQQEAQGWFETAKRGAGGLAKAARLSIETGGLELGSVGLQHHAESHGFILDLHNLNATAHKRGRFIVILIDEIQSGNPVELRELAAYLAHADNQGMPVALFAAGLPETQTFIRTQVKTYTERWLYRPVGLLTADAAREAIERPAREHGVQIESDALDVLVNAADGYPHAVQTFAAEAWEERAEEKRITRDDAERAVPHGRDKLASIYEGRLNDLTSRECMFVVALADLGHGWRAIGEVAHHMGVASSARIGSLRERLEAKDVIRSPQTGFVEFRLPGMDAFIRDHRQQFLERANAHVSRASARHSASRVDVILHGAREDVTVSGTFEGLKTHGAGTQIALVRAGDEYHGFRNVGAFSAAEIGSEVRVRQRNGDAGTQVEADAAVSDSGAAPASTEQHDDGFEL